MEPTANFAAGLAEARRQLAEEGRLTKEDDEAVRTVLSKPIVIREDGTKVRVMYRVHVRARNLYAKLQRTVLIGNVDWTALVQWLKDHWVEIVRTILTVLITII